MDENFAVFIDSGKDPYFQDQSHFTSFDYAQDNVTCKNLNFIYVTDKDTLENMKLALKEQSQRNIDDDQNNELIIMRQPITNENILDLEKTEKLQIKQRSVQKLEFMNNVLKNFNEDELENLVYYSRPMAMIISGYFTHFKSVKRVHYLNQENQQYQYELNLPSVKCLFLSQNFIENDKITKQNIDRCLVDFQVSQFLGAKDFFELFQSFSINHLNISKNQIYKKLYLIDWNQEELIDEIDLTNTINGYELTNENFSNLKSQGKIFLFLTQNSFQFVDRFIKVKDINEIKITKQKSSGNSFQNGKDNTEKHSLSNDNSSIEIADEDEFKIQCFHCKNYIEDPTKCPFCICGKIYCGRFCRNKNQNHQCKSQQCSYCKKLLEKDELYSMKINKCGDIYCEEACQDSDHLTHISSCTVCNNQINQEHKQKIQPKKKLYELGVVGLRNIGNTCYMNSALQCIFHTRILQNIFFKTNLAQMINPDNPLGSGGVLIKNFQRIFEMYWSQQYQVLQPGEFKSVVEKFMPTFKGYDQHDSQEFYSQLMDNFHEDINMIKKKPLVENLEGKFGDNENLLARQSWVNFLKRNLSLFVNYFYGQFRSLVECNKCDNKSLIFDPFSVLTLDIPKKVKKTFNIYYIPKDHQKQILRYHFRSTSCNMFKEIFIGEIKNYFAEFLKLDKDDFVICFLSREKEGQILKSRDSLFNFYERTQLFRIRPELFIYELNEQEKILRKQKSTILKFLKFSHEEFDVPEKEKDTIQYFRMQRLSSNIHEDYTFNKPFYIEQNLTNKQLYVQAFRKLFPTLEDLVEKYSHVNKTDKFYEQLWQQLTDEKQDLFYLKYQDKKIECNEQKFNLNFDLQKENDLIFLFVTKQKNLSQRVNMDNFLSCSSGDQDDYPQFIKQDQSMFKRELSIYDLFTKFQIKEQLDDMNAWYCRQCKEHVLAYKTLNIYKAPEYLVILLKKMKSYKDDFPSITFPIDELDISPYMENQESVLHYNVDHKEIIPEEQQRNQSENLQILNPPPKVSTKYKLYGVVNHYGSQMFGHYTACCYLESKSKWINFDDSSATEISKENVVSDNAYLLFYRKIDDLESLD